MSAPAPRSRPAVPLAAALIIGVAAGYGLGRVEAHRELNMVRRSIDAAQPARATAAALDAALPEADLQVAIHRLEQRARRADRLGDPELAAMWRAEAQRLRAEHTARLADE